MNSRLNELVGQSGQDRSKLARIALLDMLNGSTHFQKEVRKSITLNLKNGHGSIIQEVF